MHNYAKSHCIVCGNITTNKERKQADCIYFNVYGLTQLDLKTAFLNDVRQMHC